MGATSQGRVVMLPNWPGHFNVSSGTPGSTGGWGNPQIYHRRQINVPPGFEAPRGHIYHRRQNVPPGFEAPRFQEASTSYEFAQGAQYATHSQPSPSYGDNRHYDQDWPLYKRSDGNQLSYYQSRPMYERRRHDDAESAKPPTRVLEPFSNSDEIRHKLVLLKARLAESPLPKEFDRVVTQLSCTLCGVKSPVPKYMKPHWTSVLHADEVRHWLLKWYRKMRSSDALYRRRPKAYEYEEDEQFCFLCMKPFTSAEIAQTHYDSKQHEKRIINLLCDLAIGKYHDVHQFRCDICNVTCPTEEQLAKHLESPNHAKKLRAIGVAVEIPISTTLADHSNEMKYECQICNVKTYTEETLRVHMTSSKHLRKMKKMSGEGTIDAQGISGPSNIFTYECKICNVKAETHAQLDVHVSSKKHKTAVEKRLDPVKKEIIEEVEVKRKMTQYKCDICGVFANAEGQYLMHMNSQKHARAVARARHNADKTKTAADPSDEPSEPTKRQRSDDDPSVPAEKRQRPNLPKEEEKKKIPKAMELFLRRYRLQVPIRKTCETKDCEVLQDGEYEAASRVGNRGEMLVMVVPGEYIWHTLQRNTNIWRKQLACSSSVVMSDNADVWRVSAFFGDMSATAESEDMMSSRIAAGELLLHKLQKQYSSVQMPKDTYEKLDNYENIEEDEEEQGGGETEFVLNDDDDDDDEEVIDPDKLYIIRRENEAHKDFDEMLRFYLNDYQANLSDFRDLVFVNFYSYERSAIRQICAEFGIVAEYRRSKKGVVVLVSKIKTIYKNDPWLFLDVILYYKEQFKEFNLVRPGDSKLCLYDNVKLIDEEK
ncbi:hypothetical protein LSTR_LSTR009961 [Laodelphax striatellus]|uniref:C2H2-type domain-containing protein n=1 Tax=Laodelphax striatellus TaxID=195883 RepID=A0A482XI50_LAOST|nr:hypothetical protein LSTR_LSTR009961 [Laodelphax striatellus]